ncbi:MAG: NAD(P)H-dependent glycerol-3-phosphate dehydrogenase, partial [bacterium]|nr:NAD(P)H-dependent glycerol-3-phosphate dehydrogenase [bacterium]
GIEKDTLLLPTQIINDVLGSHIKTAVLAGPSYAQKVVAQEITAVTLAAPDCTPGYELQKVLANNYFRPYVSTDMIGVQVGAALKNVITLGIGMLNGAGYSDNTKAFLFSRGLQEMVQLCVAMGGRQETMYGLSGVGDLVLTSMGTLSKNLQIGKLLGAGGSLETILEKTGYIPEGINTVQSVHQLMRAYNVQLPISHGIYEVIFKHKTIKSMLQELMAHPLDWECH